LFLDIIDTLHLVVCLIQFAHRGTQLLDNPEKIGRRDAIVVEHSDAIKSYLVQWNGVKIDLSKLARLRWIEKMKTPELCGIFGKRRTAIRQSIRTLRKCGIQELNLTKDEKNQIELQIFHEERSRQKGRSKCGP
jgi:hypothetical protein